MNRITNGILTGAVVGMAAGGAYLAATCKGSSRAKKAMKKNAAKTIRTISSLAEELSAMLG